MARGWESKSVEDQIAEAEASRSRSAEPELTTEQREREQRTKMLTLSRTKILSDLAVTKDARYRALLERSLAHVEAELEVLKQAG
jgi:hypothetical protein